MARSLVGMYHQATLTNGKASGSHSHSAACPHLRSFLASDHSHQTIQSALRLFALSTIQGSEVRLPFGCQECDAMGVSVASQRHLCLECVFVGCSSHMRKHALENNHFISLEMEVFHAFCSGCKDVIYCESFERLLQTEVRQIHTIVRNSKASVNLPAMQTQISLTTSGWIPSESDLRVLSDHARPVLSPLSSIGLRGLKNLGNTCFMNCVLQALLHNPLLRDYFLADRHNRFMCPRRLQMAQEICLGCEMDLLFSQIFSGSTTPYSPGHFLYSIWRYSNYFAGYDQQDAHEFLISLLNGLHSHCSGSPSGCGCFVHSIFSGLLRSDVTCVKCHHTSTAYDPFFDISLNIPKNVDDSDLVTTLQTCLHNFTQPEKLDANEKAQCGKCNTYQESIKQFSIKQLPLAICIHIKRFEQNAVLKRTSTKIDTMIDFPLQIDMSPYTCTAILGNRNGILVGSHPEIYDLYAVINHQGSLDNGHYTAFVRKEDTWIKCDDDWITHAPLSAVQQSQGYLLFYIKRNIVLN